MTRRGANEGTIRARKDGRWEARAHLTSTDGHRTRRSLLGRSRTEVRDKLHAALKAEAAGLSAPSERLAVGAFLDLWLQDAVRPKVRPKTYTSYSSIVRIHLQPGLGRFPLARLNPLQVQAFLTAMSTSGLSPRTVAYARAVLRQALGQAERWGMVSRNVAKLAEPPRVPRREVQPFTPDEARSFLVAIHDDRLEGLYLVAIGIGLRQGEILGLSWADVDLAASTIIVRHALQRVAGRLELVEPQIDHQSPGGPAARDRHRGASSPSVPAAHRAAPRRIPLAGRPARARVHHDDRDADGWHCRDPSLPGIARRGRTSSPAIS
jgi:integrase